MALGSVTGVDMRERVAELTCSANLGLLADDHTLQDPWTLMHPQILSYGPDLVVLEGVLLKYGVEYSKGVTDLVN